jgi:glutamyl-tRNA synthetase
VRLPTYHLAHVVDDHLMGVDLVIRGDEWMASVPVHLQLATALGVRPVEYAHVAPLLKQDGASRRKLSKRKDPEAAVDYYRNAGYPPRAVLYYLRGLANGSLAELPLPDALAASLRLDECGRSGALLDLAKLDDISADHIATLPAADIHAAVLAWAGDHDPVLAAALAGHRDRALAALAVERDGVPNPRKDLKRWSMFADVYGYFLPPLFTPIGADRAAQATGVPADVVAAVAGDLATCYDPSPDGRAWFEQLRSLAARHGFAGSVREVAQIVRVALTGSTRSPDLHAVARVLGADEVVKRVAALAHSSAARR